MESLSRAARLQIQEQRALYLVVVAVPGDEVGHALLHRGGGLVTHGALELGGVGVGVGYVAGLQRQQILDCFFTQRFFNGFDVGAELDGVVVADVVEPERGVAGRRVRGVAAPLGVGRGRLVAHADHALDDVVNVGEVAGVVTVVEHLDGLAGKRGLGEQEQRHVWAAPGAVDGEKAQPGGRQPVKVAVAVGH